MQPTILIVDDEKHTREGLRASLEDSFDVYIAPDTAGALAVLESEHVDLMLTDLRLGGEDGMVLIEKALARARVANLAYFPPMQYTLPSSAPITIAPSATAGLPVMGEPIS